MEKSIKAATDYETRAREAIKEAKMLLSQSFLDSTVSKSYYACFYAVHARLAALGILAGTHKQTGIQLRRHFIKTKLMETKYSDIFRELAKWRLIADYTALPPIDEKKAQELVAMAEDFVTTLLQIKVD
ncbi:MAG: HEPN domain-containing protein [Deltaproteobacteria bacterium]|nr:HEPN domain-containing protein [Deltaproteobacteria bacterium]